MAAPVDFKPIHLTQADERYGRGAMRRMLGRSWWRQRGRASWAGFAAEMAICRAVNQTADPISCLKAATLLYDLDLRGIDNTARIEVKTRAVEAGWTHPEKFDYVTLPTHDGREPIKDVDLVWFCWYSMALPRTLWMLGYCRGPAEFKRRAVFFREGEPLPRGGWAKQGGAYSIEIKNLRPFPNGLFKETLPCTTAPLTSSP